MGTLEFNCACGAVGWELRDVSPQAGIRYICHCDDCQAFARFLGRPELLDAHGGTDAWQMPASHLFIARGAAHLASIHLTPRRLLRWYCRDCRFPVANTYDSSRLSFLSLPLAGCDPARADALLGPSAGHVWTKFGTGDLAHVKQVNIPAMLYRMLSRILRARLTGDWRNNPLFDRETGTPLSPPQRLTPQERAGLAGRIA